MYHQNKCFSKRAIYANHLIEEHSFSTDHPFVKGIYDLLELNKYHQKEELKYSIFRWILRGDSISEIQNKFEYLMK